MSGTLGAIRQQRKQQEEAQRKALAEAQRRAELQNNRKEVIAEICKTFGWTKLDDFAQKMINEAFAGQVVDLKKLKTDLAAWKESQQTSTEETVEQPQQQQQQQE